MKELKNYTIEELKQELQRRKELIKIQKEVNDKKALRCRNCIYCIQKENLKYFYYCQVRTYGKYNRNYCVNRSTKACDKFVNKYESKN